MTNQIASSSNNPNPGLVTREFGPLKIKMIGDALFMEGEMTFWAWSPYTKCSYRCVYCSVEAQGKSQVQTQKQDIAPFLDTFQRDGGRKHPFYIGVTSDPYPDIELELELTRYTLQELAKRPKIRVVLCTHGSMIERDIDIYKTMPNIEGIGISITTHDNEQIKNLEPGAPSFEKRISAAWKLYEAGLPVHVNITPWLPGISQADMIARELPEKMKVNVGVLSYNRHLRDYTKHVFGRDIPSAERVFGKDYPEQSMINDAFIAEHQRLGKGTKGNLNWLVLPNTGKNHTEVLR